MRFPMRSRWNGAWIWSLVLGLLVNWGEVRSQEANYDEAKVPEFTLPKILESENGERVDSVREWRESRRPEILSRFESEMYGRTPTADIEVRFTPVSEDREALQGLAVRKQITLTFAGNGREKDIHLLVYLPAKAREPVPAFIGLNFNGNHTIHPDPGIHLSQAYIRGGEGVVNHRATDKARGSSASRWPVEMILDRGFAVATIYCGDLDPDFDDGFQNGVHPLFYRTGQSEPAPDEWGTIGAWAWGLSRALDYFETDDAIDHRRVAVIGHSRLGKTSLWAGARDERFALVISNDSGCGGAALSRRRFGETVKRINTSFPHWFCANFKKYNDREDELPVDQHMLIALMAPRPVYVASATEDLWADPRGEFLSAVHAEVAFNLYGLDGLGTDAMPAPDSPIGKSIGYHRRTGRHDITAYDWEQYLNFAERHLKKR